MATGSNIAVFIFAVLTPILILLGISVFCLVRSRRRRSARPPTEDDEHYQLAMPVVHAPPKGDADHHPGIEITLSPPSARPLSASEDYEKLAILASDDGLAMSGSHTPPTPPPHTGQLPAARRAASQRV